MKNSNYLTYYFVNKLSLLSALLSILYSSDLMPTVFLAKMTKELVDSGVLYKAFSPHNCPVFLVKKKAGNGNIKNQAL